MFGGSSVTSTWGQPQQNQQQQQPSAFGQSSTFGGGGAFGQAQPTNAFGQQQPPQQQQGTGMFGGAFGANNNAAATGTTGAFGGAASGTGAFGAKPAGSGFGAFGGGGTSTGTGAFGGGGAFGTNPSTSTTNAFTQPSTSQSGGAFGAGAFGAKPAGTTAFGATAGTATSGDNVPPVTTGTSNPVYNVFTEKDTANTNITLQYQAITCMPAYRGTSFEELRVQDYAQNRKTANAGGAGAFGAFGQPATGTTTSLFGANNTSTAPANNAFGGTTNAFGQASTTTGTGTGFGAFGQQTQQQPQQGTTGGAFGAFGQPQQQQQQQQQQPAQGAFGAFGQQQPQQQQQQQQQPAAGTSIFGQAAQTGTNNAFGAKPFGAFGSTTTGTPGAFGAAAGGTTNAFGQPAAQTGTTGTGLFGANTQNQGTGAFGAFGAATNQPKPSIFGQPAATGTATTNPFGAFGQTQQQNQQGQAQQPATTGLFGTAPNLFGQNAANQQQPAQQPNAFGATQPAQQPGTGLFGGGTTNLFGGATQQPAQPAQQNAFGSSIFGAKTAAPATTGTNLFGNFGQQNTAGAAGTAQPGAGGLFGATTAQQPAATNNAFGTNLFAPKTAAPPFGATTTQPAGGLGASMFGGANSTLNASAIAPGTQGTLTASIAQPIGANLPIFSMLPPGPRAISLDQPKKKSVMFADVPTRSPVPRLQLGYTPSASKLRGFTSTNGNSQLGASLLGGGKPNALSLSTTGSASGTEAFFNGAVSTTAMGSGARQSVKKLVLDKKVEPADLMNKIGGRASPVPAPGAFRLGGPKATFSPALGIAAREKEAASERGLTTVVPAKPTGARFESHGASAESVDSGTVQSSSSREGELQDGDYYCKPPLTKLKALGYDQLSAFSGLTVGCKGKGQITFLEPVNLTEVPKLQELLGVLIQFGDNDCCIYPDYDEADRPPPGQGLNVGARIELVGNWPRDRATKESLKDLDEKDPRMRKFLKRLKEMKGTTFESYDQKEGKWTFTIEHY